MRFDLRRASPLLVPSLALIGACSTPTPFACEDDGQCQLDGAAGVCTEVGHCAYADPDCESGLRYPTGAGGALGGDCADGEGVVTTTDSGSTSSSVTTLEPSTAEPVTTEGVTSNSVTTDTSPSTTQPDPTDGGATGDPMQCEDPFPNEGPFEVPSIPLQGCQESVMGRFDEDFGPDWFRFSMDPQCEFSPFGSALFAMMEQPGELCLFVDCDVEQEVFCADMGPPQFQDGLRGCCMSAPGQVGVTPLGCDPAPDMFVRVQSWGDGDLACQPYFVDVFAQ